MKIGITSTIPVEVIFAAGHTPCDLNNIFISAADPEYFVRRAEDAGFPRTTCAWIKGIYGVLLEEEIDTVIIVSGGDCSNSIALGEVLAHDGKRIIPFSYPLKPNVTGMETAIAKLIRELETTGDKVAGCKHQLDPIRRKLAELDRLTWHDNRVSGSENLLHLVSSSDFNGNTKLFSTNLDEFMAQAIKRQPGNHKIRLGIAGVPPIISNLFAVIEELGAAVVFNEVPRQFSLPWGPQSTIAEQYTRYTYPYQVERRLDDISKHCTERRIDGLIHYTQTFCFRQIEDILFKRKLDIPVLSLEADQPGPVDGRTLTRIETFIEMLQ